MDGNGYLYTRILGYPTIYKILGHGNTEVNRPQRHLFVLGSFYFLIYSVGQKKVAPLKLFCDIFTYSEPV